jgi:hypothetical protein
MNDANTFDVSVKRWKLEKFDGDHIEGDGKEPIEVLEGGDGLPTIHYVRANGVLHATD